MQLGRGHVQFHEELPLEVVEGKTLPYAFEHRLVEEEEEWLPIVGAIVNTNGFAGGERANGDVSVVFPPKRFSYGFVSRWALQSSTLSRVEDSARSLSEAQV